MTDASPEPSDASSIGEQQLEMSCMGTGMDVTCSVDEGRTLDSSPEENGGDSCVFALSICFFFLARSEAWMILT